MRKRPPGSQLLTVELKNNGPWPKAGSEFERWVCDTFNGRYYTVITEQLNLAKIAFEDPDDEALFIIYGITTWTVKE